MVDQSALNRLQQQHHMPQPRRRQCNNKTKRTSRCRSCTDPGCCCMPVLNRHFSAILKQADDDDDDAVEDDAVVDDDEDDDARISACGIVF